LSEAVDFDLVAASLRADAGDLASFVEALATKLEGSFPEHVSVDRKGGFLGGGRRVRKLEVELGASRFGLESEAGSVACRRRNIVRGIALSSEQLSLDRWIEELSRELANAASETERGRVALQRLLES
jgi:hypothetical protein